MTSRKIHGVGREIFLKADLASYPPSPSELPLGMPTSHVEMLGFGSQLFSFEF